MAINVTQLLPSYFTSTETRDKIHRLTDTTEGPTMAERAAFAEREGQRNVTKYWPVEVVLKACDLWGIEPVLNKGGTAFVRQHDGLHYNRGGNPAEAKVAKAFEQPKVYVGEPRPVEQGDAYAPRWDAPKAEPKAGPVNTDDRERKLAALRDLVRREVDDAVGKDEEQMKDLVASISAAAAGAVLDTKGKELFAKIHQSNSDVLAKAIAMIDEVRQVELVVRTEKISVKLTGHVHVALNYVVELAAAGKNIAMIGPTGCGKTHLAEQVATALGRQYATQSVTMGMSETKVIGGLLPIGEGGKFEFYVADFVRLFRDGGVFLLDEWDAADPNVALVVNQALANGHMDLPLLGKVKRHPDFVCIAAMNTYGTGADRQYVGRSQLDEASLDRFRIGQVEMDYDRKLEKDLVGAKHESWLQRAWKVRDAIRANRLRRNMSTRFILDARDMIARGRTVEQCLTSFSLDWSPDERSKCGITPVPLF